MQRIIAILSTILMGILLIFTCVAKATNIYSLDYLSDLSLILFGILMLKKGLDSRAFRDVFNIRAIKISLKRTNAILELLLCLEFVILNIINTMELKDYAEVKISIAESFVAILIPVVAFVILYRFFFLNMFYDKMITNDWIEKLTKKKEDH